MEFIGGIGTSMSQFIFWVSSFLTQEQMPGWISILILCWLVLSLAMVVLTTRRKLTTLRWLDELIKKTANEEDFTAQSPRIDSEVKTRRTLKGYVHITAAWSEFRETLVLDETVTPPVLRNSVRPSGFFNLEDLHYGPGFHRHLPGLFVSVGLLLTFLGLISALQAIGSGLSIEATPEEMRGALNDLLGAASAKFIMSLTGLLASILFTITLRVSMGRIERSIHLLCARLEERLSFVSLEGVALKQLAIARGQEDNFKRIGLELVEKLGEPLRKEIPESIASSIGAAMAPLLDRVGKAGADGVGQMVNDLSSRFSDDVGRALSEASTQLSAAGEKIARLSDRMDQSSGRMGEEMENSVARLARAAEDLTARLASAAETTDGTLNAGAERLLGIMNETLEGIRRNTSEGADALREAADAMRTSADSFKERLEAAAESGSAAVRSRMETAGVEVSGAVSLAGKELVEAVSRSGADLLSATGSFGDKLRQDLVDPISEVVEQLDQMATRLKDGSGQIATAAGNIRAGGEATRDAAQTVTAASRELAAAAGPIRGSVEQIETAVAGLSKSTERAADTVTRSARETAEGAVRILDAAKSALGAEQKLLEATLAKLGEALTQIERQREQIDDMDEKLGSAFEEFTKHVRTAVDTLFGHVRTMNGELAPAIDKMHEIVDRAEKFLPESRR
ncbi:anti-phage ZorAB system protein ZorA [Pseudotabrizicola algicola]|uniref:Anti-phage defense protein ZorA n=1 Tax=Pseudotabrizicola algicola TaxID=2709381 RepID=A0A6B3RS02_9RHOB|nr:anti-phage ZorAB system protein ZorA [Pseudotabrizicola algicola]NEX48281.1 anti-phage defense protein ZorA [Pseudotabrizicola algicola]